MSKTMLYPEDRIAPERPVVDLEAVRAVAKQMIRDAVPRGGEAKTVDELVLFVRKDDSTDCYMLWPAEVVALVDEVRAERPVESQLEWAKSKDEGLLPGDVRLVEEEIVP
jgi:hypothetical protein